MRILAVDDEEGALRVLKLAIETAAPETEVICFQTGGSCLEYCNEHGCPDIAFLDIRIASMSGLDLARALKSLNLGLNVIFTTGYSEHAVRAMELRASGYLLKPVTASMVAAELENLRFPVKTTRKGLYAQTFGTFELFYDGEPVQFRYDKTKELFAYLLDRQGALCSNEQVMDVLWGGDGSGHESYFRQLRKDLIDTLGALGCRDVVVRRRGHVGLDISSMESDYAEWARGVPSALNAYHGEYLIQYDWAERTGMFLSNALR